MGIFDDQPSGRSSDPRKSKGYPFSVGGQGPHPSLSEQMRNHPPPPRGGGGGGGGGKQGCAVVLIAALASVARGKGWTA